MKGSSQSTSTSGICIHGCGISLCFNGNKPHCNLKEANMGKLAKSLNLKEITLRAQWASCCLFSTHVYLSFFFLLTEYPFSYAEKGIHLHVKGFNFYHATELC